MALTPGSNLGRYEIVALIGVGGMGEVYRARDSQLGREIAIKVLPERVDGGRDRSALEREARILASLQHPNIAAVFGLEEYAGRPAIALELIDGPTLEDLMAAGPPAAERALSLAAEMADALHAAHERGVVGEPETALRWLEQCTRRGFIHYPFLAERDPLLASLREDPRYVTLMDRVRGEWQSFEAKVG